MSTGMYVNNNINALGTQRIMGINNSKLSTSLQRLSSGYKINVAADDPSGLNISQQLSSQNSGMNRAIQNSQEASNVIGIAEGAMIEITSILTKMRQLAIHASNTGATSPDQIRADQAEMDSGIQSCDRISDTTRFSDQFLLNGSKGLIYNASTVVNDPMDNALVDIDNTRIDQIFKKENSALAINFSGVEDPNNQSRAIASRQATRAIIEADATVASQYGEWAADISNGYLTADQQFILTGEAGSRSFGFNNGTHLGTVVNSINNTKESIGVGATLTFDSSVTGINLDQDYIYNPAASEVRSSCEAAVYNMDENGDVVTSGVTSVSFDTTQPQYTANTLVPGKNLSADGRLYLRWTSATEYIAYKDDEYNMEVGRGSSGGVMTSSNNSDVSLAYMTLTAAADTEAGDTSVVQLGQVFEMHDATSASYAANGMNLDEMAPLVNDFGLQLGTGASGSCSCVSGIRLGENTDETGKLYYKSEYDDVAGTVTVSAYKNPSMLNEDLVASGVTDIGTPPTGDPYEVRLLEEDGDGDGEKSGIYGTFVFDGSTPASTIATGTMEFDNLGMRLYSLDYGSLSSIRVQNVEGNLWGQYKDPSSLVLERINEGVTIQENGNNAQITVNGRLIETDGLTASIANQNFSGDVTFNAGELGMTTIAQVGQDIGALMSRGGSLQAVESTVGMNDPTDPAYATWCTNARHDTSEELSEFVGGMQYQLGEGDSDVERTIYSIPGMSSSNIGKVTIDGKLYTLQDVLSGGSASLANDPVKAMKILSQALDDVTETRARLGAFQKDMLQTNINSLEITVENITKTESYIRDTNMAYESTEFTKNQILVNAGTSMLAQANQTPQNVLQLLNGGA